MLGSVTVQSIAAASSAVAAAVAVAAVVLVNPVADGIAVLLVPVAGVVAFFFAETRQKWKRERMAKRPADPALRAIEGNDNVKSVIEKEMTITNGSRLNTSSKANECEWQRRGMGTRNRRKKGREYREIFNIT